MRHIFYNNRKLPLPLYYTTLIPENKDNKDTDNLTFVNKKLTIHSETI